MGTKKTYFISDAHLGVDGDFTSKERELKLVEWLEQVKSNAAAIYFLGDLFDHWFEYRHVIPKGFNDFIAKLAELSRLGIPMYFFTGNHDMWMFGYFEKEFGIPVIRKPLYLEIEGKQFYLAHGDGLSNAPFWDRFMKAAFNNPFLQWSFARVHPNLAIGVMRYFSRKSRIANAYKDQNFDPQNEYMIEYAEMIAAQQQNLEFVIMGHRHLPIDYTLSNHKTRYINLGDWVQYFSYAVFDGNQLKLEFFENKYPIYPV